MICDSRNGTAIYIIFKRIGIINMIQTQTILDVARIIVGPRVKCIKVLKNARSAGLHDTIVVSVQSVKTNSKLAKGSLHRGLIVRTKKLHKRPDGTSVQFGENSVVLLGFLETVRTRVFGPVANELKDTGHSKSRIDGGSIGIYTPYLYIYIHKLQLH